MVIANKAHDMVVYDVSLQYIITYEKDKRVYLKEQ